MTPIWVGKENIPSELSRESIKSYSTKFYLPISSPKLFDLEHFEELKNTADPHILLFLKLEQLELSILNEGLVEQISYECTKSSPSSISIDRELKGDISKYREKLEEITKSTCFLIYF